MAHIPTFDQALYGRYWIIHKHKKKSQNVGYSIFTCVWLTSANQYCHCFVYSSSNPVCIILSLWSQFCARVDLFSRTDHSHLFIFIRLILTKTAKEASIAESFDLEISTWSTASYVNVCHSQSLFSAQTIITHLLCKLLWRQCNFAAWYKCFTFILK